MRFSYRQNLPINKSVAFSQKIGAMSAEFQIPAAGIRVSSGCREMVSMKSKRQHFLEESDCSPVYQPSPAATVAVPESAGISAERSEQGLAGFLPGSSSFLRDGEFQRLLGASHRHVSQAGKRSLTRITAAPGRNTWNEITTASLVF